MKLNLRLLLWTGAGGS